jgi:hypothetical protein
VATASPRDAPLPRRALCRHTPKVGAQCGNSARWDLRGGPPAKAVPTATIHCPPGAVAGSAEDGSWPVLRFAVP